MSDHNRSPSKVMQEAERQIERALKESDLEEGNRPAVYRLMKSVFVQYCGQIQKELNNGLNVRDIRAASALLFVNMLIRLIQQTERPEDATSTLAHLVRVIGAGASEAMPAAVHKETDADVRLALRLGGKENLEAADQWRKLPWSAYFVKTIVDVGDNDCDLYEILRGENEGSFVTVCVPHGEGDIVKYMASACADPWFARRRNYGDTKMAAAVNNALAPFKEEDGTIDAREVIVAAGALTMGYLGDIPKDERQNLIDAQIRILNGLRNQP